VVGVLRLVERCESANASAGVLESDEVRSAGASHLTPVSTGDGQAQAAAKAQRLRLWPIQMGYEMHSS
jgi:hypothetical protein